MTVQSTIERAALATPPALAGTFRGLSDKAIAWLFIGPTMLILLMINIFPLIWTVKLSFTNFKANRPNAQVLNVGIDNYVSVLTDPDIWLAMQTTAHFLFWTILLQMLIGFALAYLIDRKFRGHGFWTTVILIPMMLSPAVVDNFWAFLYQPQIGLFNYAVLGVWGARIIVLYAGLGATGTLGHHHCRHLDVDTLCDAHLPGRPAINTRLHL